MKLDSDHLPLHLYHADPNVRLETLALVCSSPKKSVFGANSRQQYYACHIPRNPPTFSGESAQDSQKWIKMFERVAKYNKWDEAQSLANVVFYLEGTAAQWFDNNEDIINSWTQFKTNLCEVFGQKEELTRPAEMTIKTRAQNRRTLKNI
ncbi:hypothetical protein LAZ67_22000708 [Cordylochernes scorpioides]|uniref:Gag protein n=1 Tax=Cordylochernes scorpioides TaxID=51811 RepID=A0ABY6LQ96_9ARAC|nr:hypothetical protein LAZ67_22000708 [Cordylochernes scorpioides]